MRAFEWDAAGRLAQATVFTLTTYFTCTGDGTRVALEVEGVGVTEFIPDRGGRILEERTATTSTRYLYGHDCLGEVRDGTLLYYLADGQGYVRQSSGTDSAVVDAWLFTPDGGVMAGPEGPVSHLVCGGVYDRSTGLLYKGGRYFDPTLGIWLALVPLVVMQGWRERKKRRGWRGVMWYVLLLVLVVGLGGVLVACGPPGPTPPLCPLPTPQSCTGVYLEPDTPWMKNRRGAYQWDANFRLTEPAKRQGWVVQHIDARSYVYDFEGEAPHEILSATNRYWHHYWEAWKVPAGSTASPAYGPESLTIDRYPFPGWDNVEVADPDKVFPQHRFGKRVVKGWFTFYELDEMPPEFDFCKANCWFKATSNGGLFGLWVWLPPPYFWEGEEDSGATHYLKVDWDRNEPEWAWGRVDWTAGSGAILSRPFSNP